MFAYCSIRDSKLSRMFALSLSLFPGQNKVIGQCTIDVIKRKMQLNDTVVQRFHHLSTLASSEPEKALISKSSFLRFFSSEKQETQAHPVESTLVTVGLLSEREIRAAFLLCPSPLP